MEIERKVMVTVSVKDMFVFFLQHTYRSAAGMAGLIFSFISLGILVYTYESIEITYKILLIVCSLLFTVINPLMLYTKAMKQIALNPALKKPITYIFTENGLIMQIEKEKAEIGWNSFYRIRDTKGYFIFYTDPVRANIIPKKCMADQKEQITAFVKERIKKV